MHDYQPEGHSINCLTFRARQIIRVLNRDPSGWWDGEVEGRRELKRAHPDLYTCKAQ